MPTIVYDLAARFSLESVGVAAGVAGLVRAFSDLERQATVAELAVKRLNDQQAMSGMTAAQRQAYQMTAALDAQTAAQEKLTLATAAFQKMLVGGLMVGAGLFGFDMLGKAVKQAQSLQSEMTGLKLATVGTLPLQTLQNTIQTTASRTMFSETDVANMARIAATNGLNNRAVLNTALPVLANIAEVDSRLKGISPEESVAASVQAAHLFQQYPTNAAQAKSFNQLLDLFGRAQLVSGLPPASMIRSLTQLAPARATLGLTPQDEIALSALAANTGLSSGAHGGAYRLAAMFRQMAPRSGTVAAKAGEQIQSIGGGQFFNQQGQFNGYINALKVVDDFLKRDKNQQQRLQLLNQAFGSAGGAAFATLSTQGGMNRLEQILKLVAAPSAGGLASTAQMQGALNKTLVGQTAQLSSNVGSIMANFGTGLIPPLTMVVSLLTKATSAILAFTQQNKGLMTLAGWVATLGSGFLVVRGSILLVQGAWALMGISGMIEQIKKLGLAMKGLAGADALAGVATWASSAGSALKVLASSYLTTTLATIRLTVAQVADALSSGAAAAGQIAVGVASRAMAVGEGIATVASGALDLALSPIVLTVGAVVAGIGAFVLIATHWRTALDVLTGKFGPFAQGLAMAFGPLFAVPATIGAIIANLPKLYQLLQRAPQAAANAGAGILSNIEHIVLPGLPQGISFSPFGTGTGGGGAGTGTGGGGLPALALAGAAGGGAAHKHYHLHVAPGAITVNSQPHHNEETLAAKVMDALSRQWGHGGQWGNTDPTGLQIGPFGY